MIGDWILDLNLVPFLEMLALVAGYDLTPEELEAVLNGVARTDRERDQWVEWRFAGAQPIDLRLARDLGTEVLHFQASGSPDSEASIALLATVMGTYRLAR